MGKHQKILTAILQGNSDANIGFADLCGLLNRLGFEEHIRSSHHIFRREGVKEMLNLQQDGNKAKTYQVRQVRDVLLKYNLDQDL